MNDKWCIGNPGYCGNWCVVNHPLLLLLFNTSHPLFLVECNRWIYYFGDVGLEIFNTHTALWSLGSNFGFLGELVV